MSLFYVRHVGVIGGNVGDAIVGFVLFFWCEQRLPSFGCHLLEDGRDKRQCVAAGQKVGREL